MIPGSGTRGLTWKRGPDTELGRTYTAKVPDGLLKAIVSRDPIPGWEQRLWHLSVSHDRADGKPGRLPSYDELKAAKYQLLSEDVAMVLVFPRKSAPYVDVYPTCLHLWESTETNIDI